MSTSLLKALLMNLNPKKKTNPMSELGLYVAKMVLEYESDAGKAAAILLLICLDFAYHSVISVSIILFMFSKSIC